MAKEKMIYVTSASGRQVSLSCPGGEGYYMSISQKMIEQGVPHPVPDNPFFHGKIEQGIIKVVHNKDAAEKWKKYITKKKAEDSKREKERMDARIAKLKAIKMKKSKRDKSRPAPVEEPVVPIEEPVVPVEDDSQKEESE